MLDDAGGDVADVGTLLADGGQAAFVLSKAVCLWKLGKGGVGGVGLLKGIDLLEEIKVALVAALEGLIGLFAAKDMDGALEEDESDDDNTAGNGSKQTSRRHEFLVARREFQWSSWAGPMSQVKSFDFSSSVQCFAPWAARSRS